MSLVSIVFSYRNEEEVLPILITSVTEALKDIPEDLELIFVDDASTDNSVDVIVGLAEHTGNLRLVKCRGVLAWRSAFLPALSTPEAMLSF